MPQRALIVKKKKKKKIQRHKKYKKINHFRPDKKIDLSFLLDTVTSCFVCDIKKWENKGESF